MLLNVKIKSTWNCYLSRQQFRCVGRWLVLGEARAEKLAHMEIRIGIHEQGLKVQLEAFLLLHQMHPEGVECECLSH